MPASESELMNSGSGAGREGRAAPRSLPSLWYPASLSLISLRKTTAAIYRQAAGHSSELDYRSTQMSTTSITTLAPPCS